jgi:hypothetical protein
MNAGLGEVSALGCDVLKDALPPAKLINLGTVLTFEFDEDRYMHMIICHHLGDDGWDYADKYVRVGMDHLWTTQDERKYSIVQIGNGAIGKRDGANTAAIHTAIASSYLPVTMWIRRETTEQVIKVIHPRGGPPVLRYSRGFSPVHGQLVLAA